jgi:hemerythrin
VHENLILGVAEMDAIHAEFDALLERVRQSSSSDFLTGFAELVAHTEAHFAAEDALMVRHGYYGLQEHRSEHETLLSEMRYFYDKAKKLPPMGRSYIDDYAYEKFHRHVINIDSQLALFLNASEETVHA